MKAKGSLHRRLKNMQKARDDHSGTLDEIGARNKKPYHRPRILSREYLEAGAGVCPKANIEQCSGGGGYTKS